MSVEHRFSRGVAWMAAGNWSEQAFNLLIFVIMTRLLGPEAFGVLAMAMGLVVLAEFLVRESFSDYLISAERTDPADCDAVFWALAALGAGLTAMLLALAGPVSRYYGEPQVAGLMRAVAASVMMIALTAVPVALLRREMAFRTLSIRAVAGVVAGGLAGILMAFSGFGIWSFAGQRLVQVGTNVVLAWYAVGWRPGFRFRGNHLAQAMRFGGTMLAQRAAELSVTQVPVLIMGPLIGAAQLGYFAIAWRIVEVAYLLIATPLRYAAQPAFAALRRGAGEPAVLLAALTRLTGFIGFPCFAGLAALAAPLLSVVAGPGWLPAASVLAALCPIGAWLCVTKIEQSFYLAHGRVGALTLLAWIEVAASGLAVLVAARFGLVAIALAFSTTLIILWPLRLRLIARTAGSSALPLGLLHLAPALAAGGMGLAVASLYRMQPPLPAALAPLPGIAAGVAIYLALSALFLRDRLAQLRRSGAMLRGPIPAVGAAAAASPSRPAPKEPAR